ncbi:MAG TPA: ATP-binding protein, partial [Chloroflexota bacterium]
GLYWSVVGGGLGYVALVAGRHGLARRSSWAVPVLWGAWCLALASLFQARPLPLIGPVQHALAAALHVGGWGLVGVAALASLRGVGGQGGPEGAVRESRLPMLSAGVAGVTVLLTAELVLRLRAGVPAQWYVGPVLLLGLVVARQFLTLVENRQLIRRLVAAKRAEAELREVGLALGSNLEFDRVLETICQIAQRLVGADVVFCWLLDDAGGALELRAATGGRAGEFIGRRCTLADGEALAVRVLLEARPRVVGWRAGGERPNPFYSLVLGIRTWLAVPLTLGGKVFGVLECGSGSPRDLGLEEVAKVELLAAQAVVALENAHLYEQAQRRLRVALALSDLLASTQRARNQVDVGRALLEVLDLRLGFDRGAVYLVEGARRLTSAVTGAFDPVLGRCHVSEHEKVEADGFIEATAWNGRPSRWWSEHAPIPTARLAVPLWMRDQVVGVVAVERSGRPYTSGDERLALALAHQAALVLENLTLSAEAQQVEALRELHRIKSDLFSMLSHDLRAPLSTVKSYAEALREDEGLLSPEERREYLGVIREESDRLLELVGDLLDLSRMEAGVLRVEPEPVPLARVVEEMVRWARGQARGHQIEVDVPPDLLVEADPRRLRQVLRNLLENAIKYSPSGGRVRVHAAVRCGAAPERGRSGGGVAADEVVISVSDEGMGIPRHLQEQIFQPFRRVPGRGTSRIDGAGLGLAICKGLVEAQDGRIWVESEIGRGSTFFFTLPLCRVSDEEPGEGVE